MRVMGKGKNSEINEEEMFEVQQTQLLYKQAPRLSEENTWSKRLKHTSFLEHATHFWRKAPLFSDAIDNV